MAETVVSFVLEELCQFVKEERSSVAGIERDFNDIKDELESIQAFLKDADTKADDDGGGGGGGSNGVKTWVKQLREVSFRIEDVIDEYNMYEAQRVNHSRFRSVLQMIPGFIKTMNPHHQIASEIQDIMLSLGKIKERSMRFEFRSESGLESSYRGTKAPRIGDPRMAPYFIEETQVVGFEIPRDELVSCLVGGNNELMLVSVVGMGGLGKTTLAKHVFDNQLVKRHFDCRSFITVSQSYTIRELLTDMVKKFCKDNNEPIPKGLLKMDDETLITHVRQYLESKRLQPLPPNKAWELFCNKAFRGQCPADLEDISKEIVQKCGGLPLAVVAIGGLLSTKAKTMFEWMKVHILPVIGHMKMQFVSSFLLRCA